MTEMQYYDLNPALSRGALLTLITGQRGVGKTYASKKWAIEDWIKNKKEFAYLRRLESETAQIKGNLFDDIAYKYGKSVRCRGYIFEIRNVQPMGIEGEELRDWLINNPWETFGYAMSLNIQQDYKSGSWPNVNKIIFDEFIIENPARRYLANEPDQFVNLISTVLRERKGRIIALSNAGAMYNPYFAYYGVASKDLQQDFISRRGGSVIIQIYRNEANNEVLKKGLMGKLGNDNYVNYAIESKFRDIDDLLIKPIDNIQITGQFYNLVSGTNRSYIFCNTSDGLNYVHPGQRGDLKTYSLSESNYEYPYNKKLIAELRERFHRKTIIFDTIDSRIDVLSAINL